jgi:hypothetical protein
MEAFDWLSLPAKALDMDLLCPYNSMGYKSNEFLIEAQFDGG